MGGGDEGSVACTWSPVDDKGLTGDDTGLIRDDTGLTGDDTELTGDDAELTGGVTGLIGDDTGLTGDDIGLKEECSTWLVCNSLSSVLSLPPTFSSLLHSLSLFICTSFSKSTMDGKLT